MKSYLWEILLDEWLKVSPMQMETYIKEHRDALCVLLKDLAENGDQISQNKLYGLIQLLISYQEEEVYVVGVHKYNLLEKMKELQAVQIFNQQEYLAYMADYIMKNRKVEKELAILFESIIQENIKGL